VTGWFTEDFTLAELKTLRAKERLPQLRPGNTAYDGRFPVPTLQEIIDLVRATPRRVGIYPEIKHPTYFRTIGLPLEERLVSVLCHNNLGHRGAAVYIQSFETANLRRLNRLIDVPLIQLLDATGRPYDFVRSGDKRTYQDLTKPANLRWIRSYADGVGVNKELIVPRDATGRSAEPSSLVSDAHATGLAVHAWTFRNENHFLPLDLRSRGGRAGYGNALAEYWLFAELGVDGVFTDHPDTAASAIGELLVPRAS
jgi:glycerophosphoryl diester phosphodiesterase